VISAAAPVRSTRFVPTEGDSWSTRNDDSVACYFVNPAVQFNTTVNGTDGLCRLGHNERRTTIGADVVHRQDVRVVQCRRRAGLLLESMEAAEVGRECRGQNFDRNITSEPRIARTVHLAHAARAKGGDNFVRAEARTVCEGQVGVDYMGGTAAQTRLLHCNAVLFRNVGRLPSESWPRSPHGDLNESYALSARFGRVLLGFSVPFSRSD
jgi:hypothetical protein